MHDGVTPEHRVLLVEDNKGDADLICDYLSDDPTFEVEPVSRLSTAVARLSEARFDVALLDLHLPDSSGVDTFLRLHLAAPDLPIVVLTGEKRDATALAAVSHGAQDFLVKGNVDAAGLLRSLRFALERKRSDAVNEARRTEAARQEKLAALGILVAGVSHELNNPLAVVQGNAEIALDILRDSTASAAQLTREEVEELQGHLESILRGADRLAVVARALRQSANETLDGVVHVRLEQIVSERLAVFRQRYPHAKTAVDGEIGRSVPFSIEAARQIVSQLLENAADATFEVPGAMVIVRLAATPEGATIEVTDNGVGILPEGQRQVFSPFFTTKPDRLGLGLHRSHAIARAHGGSLQLVETAPGAGTTFRLLVPWSVQQR